MGQETKKKKRLTKAAKLKFIEGSGGTVKAVAARAGVTRRTIHRWLVADPDLAEALKTERTETTDTAEGNIVAAIRKGNLKASIWWLSTIGKDRGFTTRQEVKANVNHQGQVTIVIPDNGREPSQ